MNETTTALPAEAGGYEIARFNALRHGVLSRYTVLPWEDEGEYRALLDALVAQHAPQGPTEEHLITTLLIVYEHLFEGQRRYSPPEIMRQARRRGALNRAVRRPT